jgi:hypothetical protein
MCRICMSTISHLPFNRFNKPLTCPNRVLKLMKLNKSCTCCPTIRLQMGTTPWTCCPAGLGLEEARDAAPGVGHKLKQLKNRICYNWSARTSRTSASDVCYSLLLSFSDSPI